MMYADSALDHSVKVYSKPGLHLYDALVMGVFAKHVWGCSPDQFINHYQQHITSNHADIGVGTGFCLDHCEFDVTEPRIALIDLRQECLDYCARRLLRYQPETYVRDARDPIQVSTRRFDSIALGGLLHCLSGDMQDKGRVFDSIAPITAGNAKVFGYSLVGDSVGKTGPRRIVHKVLNRLRVINNKGDRLVDLAAELAKRFVDCQLQLIGSVAFFSAVVPNRSPGPFRYTQGAL